MLLSDSEIRCVSNELSSLSESEAGSLCEGDERCCHLLHQQSAEGLQGNVNTSAMFLTSIIVHIRVIALFWFLKVWDLDKPK